MGRNRGGREGDELFKSHASRWICRHDSARERGKRAEMRGGEDETFVLGFCLLLVDASVA